MIVSHEHILHLGVSLAEATRLCNALHIPDQGIHAEVTLEHLSEGSDGKLHGSWDVRLVTNIEEDKP